MGKELDSTRLAQILQENPDLRRLYVTRIVNDLRVGKKRQDVRAKAIEALDSSDPQTVARVVEAADKIRRRRTDIKLNQA